jgi:GNAT superfamily N-acetyltransferase
MPIATRRAGIADAATLHALAEATFALACPPGTDPAAIEDFLSTTLSEASFESYLGDPWRELFLAFDGAHPVGYTMVIYGEPSDRDVLAVISLHPSSELSKVYVLENHHGSGVARSLVEASLQAARERGAAGMWLGVNELNERANRFYEKNGFAHVGSKKFLLGGKYENDFVRELSL